MFSIIVPVYNKQNVLVNTVHSILNQSFKSFELILVNDGSTDNSLNILKTFSDDRIILINKANGGVSSARNAGIKFAKYEFVIFLDADDLLNENSLSSYNEWITKYPDNDVYISKFKLTRNNLECIYNESIPIGLIRDNFLELTNGNLFLRMGNFAIRNNKLLFNENISIYEDFDFIFRLAKCSSFVFCDFISMSYQQDFSFECLRIHSYKKEWIFNVSEDLISCKELRFFLFKHLAQRVYVHMKKKDLIGAIFLVCKMIKDFYYANIE